MAGNTDLGWPEGTGGQRLNLQFRLERPAAFDATHDRLLATGYRTPWDASWVQRFARVCDPDGNVVNLFAPLG